MIIKTDLKHRGSTTRAETFDQRNRKTTIRSSFTGLDTEAFTNMFGDPRLTHNPAGQRLTNLKVILANRRRVQHRIEGGNFPDVGNSQAQTLREICNPRRIQIAALALHNKHEG